MAARTLRSPTNRVVTPAETGPPVRPRVRAGAACRSPTPGRRQPQHAAPARAPAGEPWPRHRTLVPLPEQCRSLLSLPLRAAPPHRIWIP
ncbi:hypothetical protein PAHAL_3G467400 [Panicum hallii]|uniref:Uncharacterized protein n=1 Tax=Panicum hallii TaxID=206008 RepID=A0A2T8KLL0_9POAL|nr:hypothetical protein PAHAL_3G467400 [Panicum hallii]